MAVKGKGKEVASAPPRARAAAAAAAAAAASGSGRRRKASGEAGPSSSSASAKRRRPRSGVLQFVDDAAYVAEEDEDGDKELESEEDLDDVDEAGFSTEEKPEDVPPKGTGKSHPLPFLVKEEQLSGDELEEFIKERYTHGVKYAPDGDDAKERDGIFTLAGALKEPTIWRVKCMVGRERQMAFCFMQKFVDLHNFGTKVPIISAFALDHVRGFVFVEAEKACDVTEACKGFCSVYASRISAVPAAEVPSLLSSRAKSFELSPGTWVRMKSGNYKGDLAQVVSVEDGRKRVMTKLIPRVDLQAISKKFGGAISLKQAAVPAPRLISSQELEFFEPHIETRRDRQTGDVFEVLDGLMFKDGYLYKRVAISSLIYWGIQPTETELLKFSSSSSSKNVAEDMDWVSSIYGPNKKKFPRESNINASTSREKSSKASSLKASTSNENYDDEFNLHDLVLFGRKDFGVIIAVEKDGFRILKGGPEGSAVTVRKQDIKKGCVDKMFTAVDHEKKIISINDTVNVLEGPFEGKQGVVKHLYKGTLFIYNESESENCGFFCAQCESCKAIKKQKELANSVAENLEDNPIPMFSQSPIRSYDQNEQRDTDRQRRTDREQLFSIGQTLRIRKGPLKGYLCRVVRIFRNDVTVKLDSLVKIITVEAQFLSVPTKRGNDTSDAPSDLFGSQDIPFLGSQAEKTSWDNGLSSFGSDSWQPFSSSTFPDQKEEADPWGKKTSLAEGDSALDAWGKPASTSDQPSPWATSNDRPNQAANQNDTWQKNVEVWSNNTTQRGGSGDSVWCQQTGGSNLDTGGGSSWDRAAINKENEKSDNWGQTSSAANMETAVAGDTDTWGSKIKEVDNKETDSWEKASVLPEKPDNGSQGWGQPFGGSSQAQEKDANWSGGWDTAAAKQKQSSAAGVKYDALPVAQDDAWGKSKGNSDAETVGRNKAGSSNQNGDSGGWDAAASNWKKSAGVDRRHSDEWGKEKDPAAAQDRSWGKSEGNGEGEAWNKVGALDQLGSDNWNRPKLFGGDGRSSWNKGEEVDRDNQNGSRKRSGDLEGGCGFGRGRGRGRGQESGDWGNRDDQGIWKSSWGGDRSGRAPWKSDSQGDNETGDFDGYRGRGRGRGQYGGRGRGRGRDNDWRKGDQGNSYSGRERSSDDTPSWANSQPKSGDGGSNDWNKGASTKGSWGGGDGWNSSNPSSSQPWNSSQSTKPFGENQTSTWNKSEDNQPSGGQERQNNPWASKKAPTAGEQQSDPWASKMTSSTSGAEDNNDGWNAKGKDTTFSGEGKWDNAADGNSGAEEKADAWNAKGASTGLNNNKTDAWGWNNAGVSGGQESSWGKLASSSGDQESTWNKPRYGDDNPGYSRGGFGRGNRGRGRGRNFGDSGSSWGGGSTRNDESGGERSEDHWNRQRDFNGGRGRGGHFGRGSYNQENDSGLGDRDGGGWASGRGNRGRGGGDWGSGRGGNRDQGGGSRWGNRDQDEGGSHGGAWSQSSGSKNGGHTERDQAFSEGKPCSWNDKNSWGMPKPSGGDDQAGKGDQENAWSRSTLSFGGGGSWEKSKEDNWSVGRGTGGSGSTLGKSLLAEAKSGWGNDKNDSWGMPKPSGGDGQAGKGDQDNVWSQNTSSSGGGSSVWGQLMGDTNKSSKRGAPPSDTARGGGGDSWRRSKEDNWNTARGTVGMGSTWENSSWGEAKVGTEQEGSWGKAAPKPSGDSQAGNSNQDNVWSRNPSSGGGSSAVGQPISNADKPSILGAPPCDTTRGRGRGSWGNSNEDNNRNVGRETGGSGSTWEKSSWGDEKAEGSGSQGGVGSSWDKAGGAWSSNKGNKDGGGGNNGW